MVWVEGGNDDDLLATAGTGPAAGWVVNGGVDDMKPLFPAVVD